MTFRERAQALVAHFDNNQTKCAIAIGVKQPTVAGWLNGEHGMAETTAIKIEIATDGVFRAADFCPELAKLSSVA